MSRQLEYKNPLFVKGLCLSTGMFLCLLLPAVSARRHQSSVTKHSSKTHNLKKSHKKIVKTISPEEIAAARAAQAREAEESRFNQSRNAIISRAYQLYDSGTNQFLLGNFKYSILQLKLASQILSDHGEENSALDIATLSALASSAQLGGDVQLSRLMYQKLLSMNPQDTSILLRLARLEAANGNFPAALVNVNRVLNSNSDNQEALQLADLINSKTKIISTK